MSGNTVSKLLGKQELKEDLLFNLKVLMTAQMLLQVEIFMILLNKMKMKENTKI